MTQAEDQAARHLYASSMRDALTNLFNRRYFVQRLHSEAAHAARHKTPLSVLVLNIDGFRKINATHGHGAGDSVLQNFARVIQRELRAEDVVARVESQDFAVLLRGLGESAAVACAERLRAAVKKEIVPAPKTPGVTVSVGIATADDRTENILELASSRLRMAKSLGRDQVCWS
jgi:diguanylate cyclase (GGDEF)-like protein